MKQTLKSNDPRLTAYALGELSREETVEVEQQLKGNPQLQKEVEQIDAFNVSLAETFGNADAVKLSPSQRSNVYQSGKNPSSDDIISIHKKQWLRPVIVTLGAAAVLTLSFAWLNNMAGRDNMNGKPDFANINNDDLIAPVVPNDTKWNANHQNNGASNVSSNTVVPFDTTGDHKVEDMNQGMMHHPVQLRDEIAKNASAVAGDNLVEITENNWGSRADKAMTRLPLVCGNASWKWMTQWVESSSSSKPNKNAVRLEEIINHFQYTKPADIQIGNIQTGVSLVQCPWNSQHQIAVVLVQNNSNKDTYVEAAVTMSEAVSEYRLLGYAQATQPESAKIAPAKINIAAGYSHLCMFEIKLNQTAEIGSDVLTLSVNTQQHSEDELQSNSLNIQHSDLAWNNAPQDVQFSLILASWAQVIADSKLDGNMDATKLGTMINQFETSFEPSREQVKALQLLKKSLQ